MAIAEPRTEHPTVIELASIDAGMADLVGGKAANLGELLRAGLAVPPGFCLTTDAYRKALRLDPVIEELGHTPAEDGERLNELAARARAVILDTPVSDSLRAAVVDAYERIGGDGRAAVAVRSSATAEDLPDASFAGQQDTYLDITGADEVVDAVRRCWASLWTDRAVAYRAANGIGHDSVYQAVVVQRMVDARVAGVLFTANPVTGTRTETVVDAAPGLGTAVVDGSVLPDHYVLDGRPATAPEGCLNSAQLAELHEVGRRIEAHFGSPQDAEWAIDASGLWLVQSRPITTLFPLPETSRPGPRVYLSASAAQGVLQPMTPMGMSAMRLAAAGFLQVAGIKTDPVDGPDGFVDVGGRMYIDVTGVVRSRRTRKNLRDRIAIQGPRVASAIERVLEDPRFSPRPGLPFRKRSVARVMLRFAAPAAVSILRTLARPDAARTRMYRLGEELERVTTAPDGPATMEERLRFVAHAGRSSMAPEMMSILWPLWAAMAASWTPESLLKGIAEEGEVATVLRGMPHNPTTEMDLALWKLASEATGDARELLANTPPEELAARYRNGTLPDIGLDAFLDAYGRRAVAEIDLGVPRWAEDPTPVFAAIAGYLRVTDPEQAPDRRFARAAAEAEAKIDDLVRRARAKRPVRGRLAGFMMRRARALAGLRELPKFCWLHGLAQMREQLLLAGEELADNGLLDRPDDIMFLGFREAQAAVRGADLRELVARRRATYEREMRRRNVPSVLLSDGTDPETLGAPAPDSEGVLAGMPAAPGKVTGRARVILDPAGARLEPGEILVAPSTDPGWTPLFMTAGGLVTETGSPVSHGPTVAREYGIPAVIGVRDATHLVRTGQEITLDAANGTVTLGEDGGRE